MTFYKPEMLFVREIIISMFPIFFTIKCFHFSFIGVFGNSFLKVFGRGKCNLTFAGKKKRIYQWVICRIILIENQSFVLARRKNSGFRNVDFIIQNMVQIKRLVVWELKVDRWFMKILLLQVIKFNRFIIYTIKAKFYLSFWYLSFVVIVWCPKPNMS